MRNPSPQPPATVQPEVHARLAVSHERGEVAALGRRERDAVLDALAHARVGAEDDVAHASQGGLRRRLRRREPALDRSRPLHWPRAARTTHQSNNANSDRPPTPITM